MSKHYVIIGGVAAGPSAAARLKRIDPDCQVTLLEKTDTISYGTCELPYVISGDISSFQDIVFFDADSFKKEKQADVIINAAVHTVDFDKKIVYYDHGIYNSKHDIAYDKLLIATGASPKKLPQLESNNSFAIKSLDSAKQVQRFIQSEKPNHVVIFGGGFIGLEMAESLKKLGLQVSLILSGQTLLGGKIDSPDSEMIESVCNDHQIIIYKNEKLKSANKNAYGRIDKLDFESGLTLYPNLIIQSIGFLPNTSIKGFEKLKKSDNGAILVNSKMETSEKDIFAAGDCCVLEKHRWMPLATTASKMGRTAASSMAGKIDSFQNQWGTFALKFFDYEIAHSGLTLSEAKKSNPDCEEVRIKSSSRVGIYPGAKRIRVQLVYDKKSGKLLGGTIIGQEGAALRINLISLALQNKMTIQQLREADFMYTPPFSPLWDPVIIAANQAKV